MFVLEIKSGKLLKCTISEISSSDIRVVYKEFGFNWKKLSKESHSITYCIKSKALGNAILGLLNLIEVDGMLIMNLVEVSKSNFGKNKKLDYVAGCLIAYACQKSFEIESPYKGFLTFNSKTELTKLYKTKCYAKQINDQRMYIEPENGVKLVKEYLDRKYE